MSSEVPEPSPAHEHIGRAQPRTRVSPAQRRALQHIADNAGRLYGSRRDFHGIRADVITRLLRADLIEPPGWTPTRTWELTQAGHAALTDGSASDRVTADAEPSTGRLGHK